MLHGIYWTCSLAELALLGKAVLVAVLGQGAVLPPPPGSQDVGAAGLLCMYVSIVAALLCSFAEAWLCAALVAHWRKAHEAAREARSAGGAAEPLLGKQGKAAEVRAVAAVGEGYMGAAGSTAVACCAIYLPSRTHTLTLRLPQEHESATIRELAGLAVPDGHLLLLAFTAGAAAALGQVRQPWAAAPGRIALRGCAGPGRLPTHDTRPCALHYSTPPRRP